MPYPDLLSMDGFLVLEQVTLSIYAKLPQPLTAAGIHLYTWVPKNTTQRPQPGLALKPEPLNRTRFPRVYTRLDHDEMKVFSKR